MHGWDKRYELTVSGYQLAVLLHFNDRDCETVRGISAAVNLAVGDVVKLLKPFVKLQVITASSEMLDEETLISLNKAFSRYRGRRRRSLCLVF